MVVSVAQCCSNSCRLLFLHHFQRLGCCPQLSACRNGMNMARMFSLPSVRGQNLSASTHERWVQSVGLQGRTGTEPEQFAPKVSSIAELQRPSHCSLRAGTPKLQFLHVFAIWIHLAYQGAILVAWTKFVYPKDRKAEFVLLQVRGGLILGTLHPHALVRWQRPTWTSKQRWK